MLKIECEHAAPLDRFVAFGMMDAGRFKFVNDLADVFRAGRHPAKPAHQLGFETLVIVGRRQVRKPVRVVGAVLVKEVHV